MNAIVHAFKSSMTHVAGRTSVLPRVWHLRGVISLVLLIVMSALAVIYVKDMNRRLLAQVESARVSVEAQHWQHDEMLLQRGRLLRADALVVQAKAQHMSAPGRVTFVEATTD